MGGIYEVLGRMVASLFEAAVQALSKLSVKSESQAKCEVLHCFEKMLVGLNNAASSGFKDIYKSCKSALQDKSLAVRWAAAKVLTKSENPNSVEDPGLK